MQQLPLLNLNQNLSVYKYMHDKNPSFGMDIFSNNFKADGLVILENNGKEGKGIPIRCDFFTLIFTLKGLSIRHINQHDYETKERSLQLLSPGVIHSSEDIQKDTQRIVLLFEKQFLPNNLDELLIFHEQNPQYVDLNLLEFTHILDICKEIDLEYKNKKINYKEISKYLLVKILFLLKRKILSNKKTIIHNRAEQISNQFLYLIEKHFQNLKSVQEYAYLLEITPNHLTETIKNNLNESALHFIHKRIMKEIQYLLCYSTLSIKQIASSLSFNNSSELGRFFKRYEGISPKRYRLNLHKP